MTFRSSAEFTKKKVNILLDSYMSVNGSINVHSRIVEKSFAKQKAQSITKAPSYTPTGIKIAKKIEKTSAINDGIRSLADSMRLKNSVKEKELRLECIAQIPDGEIKTSLLVNFLNEENIKTENDRKNDAQKSNVIPGESLDRRFSIVDLMNE